MTKNKNSLEVEAAPAVGRETKSLQIKVIGQGVDKLELSFSSGQCL